MATKKQLAERAERLQQAVDSALKRAPKGDLLIPVVTTAGVRAGFTKGTPQRIRLVLAGISELQASHRVGEFGDKFFELKLVPESRSLALLCNFQGDLFEDFTTLAQAKERRDTFVLVQTSDVVRAYDGNEIRAIIKLLNNIH